MSQLGLELGLGPQNGIFFFFICVKMLQTTLSCSPGTVYMKNNSTIVMMSSWCNLGNGDIMTWRTNQTVYCLLTMVQEVYKRTHSLTPRIISCFYMQGRAKVWDILGCQFPWETLIIHGRGDVPLNILWPPDLLICSDPVIDPQTHSDPETTPSLSRPCNNPQTYSLAR